MSILALKMSVKRDFAEVSISFVWTVELVGGVSSDVMKTIISFRRILKTWNVLNVDSIV